MPRPERAAPGPRGPVRGPGAKPGLGCPGRDRRAAVPEGQRERRAAVRAAVLAAGVTGEDDGACWLCSNCPCVLKVLKVKLKSGK